jgi:hypothetical protein
MYENSNIMTKINEIYLGLCGNSPRYVNEYCESESDGKVDGFIAGCGKCRGGVAIAIWYGVYGSSRGGGHGCGLDIFYLFLKPFNLGFCNQTANLPFLGLGDTGEDEELVLVDDLVDLI